MATTNLVKSPSVSFARALSNTFIKYWVVNNVPADHVSSLVDVGNTVEESLNT